ncbi:unnamed protein product [Victoria cruziana]
MASFRGLLTPKRSFLSSRLPFQRIRRFRAVPGGQGFTNVYTRDYDLKLNRRISNLGRVFDYVKRSCVRRTSSAGKCLSFGALFGVPVATGLYGLYSKVYSMDEDKFLVEAHDSDISMQWKELWMWATRLWLPIVGSILQFGDKDLTEGSCFLRRRLNSRTMGFCLWPGWNLETKRLRWLAYWGGGGFCMVHVLNTPLI